MVDCYLLNFVILYTFKLHTRFRYLVFVNKVLYFCTFFTPFPVWHTHMGQYLALFCISPNIPLNVLHMLGPWWSIFTPTCPQHYKFSSNAAFFAHTRRPFYTVEDMERTVCLLPESHWFGQSSKGETTCNFSSAFWDRQTTHPTPTHR